MNCITVHMMIVQRKNPMNKTPAYKYILCLILSLALCLAFCACGGTEAAEPSETPAGSHVSGGFEEGPNYGVKPEVVNPLDDPKAEELFINAVRNAVPGDYPDITIGEAYENYFSSPEWSAFEAASSYDDDTIDFIVEFKGGCIYKDAEAQALIQFTFDPELEGFEATFFSLDGEPMEFRDLNAVSEIAYYQLSEEKKAG